jgi:hypothetical protein
MSSVWEYSANIIFQNYARLWVIFKYSGIEFRTFKYMKKYSDNNFSHRTYNFLVGFHLWLLIRGCIQKFPDWPPGARTANGTAFFHHMQLYRYFVSQSSEFCRHNPLCCFSTSVYCCCCCLLRYDSYILRVCFRVQNCFFYPFLERF